MSLNALPPNTRRYRFCLERQLSPAAGPTVTFVMLNPSTANRTENDPTIRRCMGFSAQWGYHRLLVCNLFALRATKPQELASARYPVGRGNDSAIGICAANADLIVLAWGNHGSLRDRAHRVRQLLLKEAVPICHFGETQRGQPRHPLYVRSAEPLTSWDRSLPTARSPEMRSPFA